MQEFRLRDFFKEILKTQSNRILIALVAAMTIGQFAYLAGVLFEHSTHIAILKSKDSDAAKAVDVADRTRFWNDNKWRPYGVVYYRVARAISYVSGIHLAKNDLERQRRLHFSLVLTSLIAVYLLSFLLSTLITSSWQHRMLATTVLVPGLLSDYDWSLFIFRAHPDQIFGLTVAGATLASLQFIRNPQSQKWLMVSAFAWALAMSTKMTTLLFGPGVLATLIHTSRRDTFQNIKKFLGFALVGYLLIGLPQNFDIPGSIKFLVKQSPNIVRIDSEFFKIWIDLFFHQLRMPILLLLLFIFLLPPRRDVPHLDRGQYWRFVALVLVPTIVLLTRKILSPYTYYPIPFVASLLVFVAVRMNSLNALVTPKIFDRIRQNGVYLLALLAAASLTIQIPPTSWAYVSADQNECRQEATRLFKVLEDGIRDGKKILADPHSPYNPEMKKKLVSEWEFHREHLARDLDLIALKSNYYRRYLTLAEGGTELAATFHVKDVEKIREFYRLFWKKSETVDPHGATWVKTYEDACTFELWQRKGTK